MAKHSSTVGRILTISWATAGTYLAASMGGAISLVMPKIAADLTLSSSQAQWILAGYLLARVGMLKPAGSLSDGLGPRTMFVLGMLLFSATSFGCALVSHEAMLVSLRILQGIAAALLSPSSLVLLRNCMPPSRRARDMTIWSFAGIAGFGLSPVLGGLLVSGWGWQALFNFCGAGAALICIAFLVGTRGAPAQALAPGGRPPILKDVAVSIILVVFAFLIGKDDVKGSVYFLLAILMVTAETERGVLLRASVWQPGLARCCRCWSD